MGFFDVKIKRLALLLLPTFYRKPLLAAFAQSMVQGISVAHGRFMQWGKEKQYRLTHNGQVCHLRAVLNDVFDPIQRRIVIEDQWATDAKEGQRVFIRETDRPVKTPLRLTGEAYIVNRRGFGGINGYDFWVVLPVALQGKADENRVTALVDTYKLASMRWTITYK